VIANSLAMATFYAIVSDSGKALFIDYGTASPSFWEAFLRTGEAHERIRFVEHGVEAMRARHGLRSIDAAMPTHVHDDHVNGFPHLARRYGTKIWCYENMAEILENPRGRNVACLLGEPMKVERTFRDGETFRWEEFEFTMKHSPGHTNFQMALFSTVDGKRIAFTGDAFFNDAARPSEIRHNLIYRNDVRSGDHARSIRNILDFDPQIIAPGHGQPFAINREMALRFEEKMRRQDRFFRELIADPDTDFGLDPSWAHIFPYQSVATPGGTLRLELRVRNHRSRPIDVEAILVVPSGWAATPASIRFTVGARVSGRSSVSVRVPPGWRGQRLAIAADVTVDGRYLGEIAEAVVDVRSGRG
jgi:glyoxylase-like metal-dependent hydrolase (beta-lactamase superfamily II)